MRFLTKLLCFCLFVTHVFAEETLFKSLASSYLNNPQINSQREKTKALMFFFVCLQRTYLRKKLYLNH